jgi:plastocyanin
MRMNSRSARWTALLLLFFACFGGVASASPPTETHHILISGFKYQPDVLTAHVGDTVEWKNADIVPHTVTAADKSFNSGAIKPGATWKLIVKKAGTYPYACMPHPNMRGTLIVE